MEDEFLTVAQIAELLKLNEQTIRNWIDRGELAAVRLGVRRVRVRQSELDRFIAAGETAPLTQEPGTHSARTAGDGTEELRERVRVALAETGDALESDDERLAGSLDSLVAAVQGLTKALERRSARRR